MALDRRSPPAGGGGSGLGGAPVFPSRAEEGLPWRAAGWFDGRLIGWISAQSTTPRGDRGLTGCSFHNIEPPGLLIQRNRVEVLGAAIERSYRFDLPVPPEENR